MRLAFEGKAEYLSGEELRRQLEAVAAVGVEARYTDEDPSAAAESEIAVIHSGIRAGEDFLQRWPRLELLITTTSGWDHIDLAATGRRGIRVARCPLARRDAVVETSLALGLSLLRGVAGLHERGRQGIWARGELPARRLGLARQATVGVVGGGVIGRRAATAWEALGARVLLCDPAFEETLPIEEVAARCDLLTLHCSLTPTSEGLIDGRVLNLIKPGGILVNTARGRCVDLDALAMAHHLGGVALDVFPAEPWPALANWARRENVIVLPHAAGYFDGLGEAVAAEVAETVRRWRENRPLPHEVSGGEA